MTTDEMIVGDIYEYRHLFKDGGVHEHYIFIYDGENTKHNIKPVGRVIWSYPAAAIFKVGDTVWPPYCECITVAE